MKLTIVPFESIPLDLPGATVRRLRRILPWRFRVCERVAEPVPASGMAALDVEQVFALLPTGDRHDELAVALTGCALVASDLGHVFGYASPERHLAVISLHQLADGTGARRGGKRLLIERVTKEVLHETGHLMGLTHCDQPGCVMQYSQTLHDTDIKECRFCGQCLKELSRLPEPAGER